MRWPGRLRHDRVPRPALEAGVSPIHDRPTARELLSTVADLLESEVLRATSGVLQHQVRVAANLCRIVERELSLEPAADRRERALLAELLETEADHDDTLTLTRFVDERLAGSVDGDLDDRAHAAVVEIVRTKLAAAKPGHDDYDFAPERQRGGGR